MEVDYFWLHEHKPPLCGRLCGSFLIRNTYPSQIFLTRLRSWSPWKKRMKTTLYTLSPWWGGRGKGVRGEGGGREGRKERERNKNEGATVTEPHVTTTRKRRNGGRIWWPCWVEAERGREEREEREEAVVRERTVEGSSSGSSISACLRNTLPRHARHSTRSNVGIRSRAITPVTNLREREH